MVETILSVGIDIGTSTTQVIFSRLKINNTSVLGMTPRFEIVSKEIIYRSKIQFTPLISDSEIDASGVRQIIEKEYANAGLKPCDISTGAVIITGESSRKRNAKQITDEIAEFAGNFVVASAGPELESVLAGKGSGCCLLSEKTGKLTANLDIGGGTTNICYFLDGNVVDTACFDIGGRLIRVKDGKIEYISEKLSALLKSKNININKGDELKRVTADKICVIMSDVLCQAVGLAEKTDDINLMMTNHGITVDEMPELFTLSGGVAECLNTAYTDFEFGDIGVLFAKALKKSLFFNGNRTIASAETINATVIGAGNFSMELSGSTIEYRNCNFPYKCVPIVKVNFSKNEEIDSLDALIEDAVSGFIKTQDEAATRPAIAFKAPHNPSFKQILLMADKLKIATEKYYTSTDTLIIIIEEDIAKALGQAFGRITADRAYMCVDGICCSNYDYIDLGKPVANGKVIPVIIKTLIFNA